MEGQNGLPLGINLNDARDMVCECGGKIFMPGVRFKKLSKIMTGNPQDTIIPIEMYLCTTCGVPLQELLPLELQDKKANPLIK
jgi:DNA-directed RNA polymerase subunit RPC12/RpoP